MKTTAALVAAFGLTAAAPVLAQTDMEMDVETVTCAEYLDMDEAGKMAAAEALVAELESPMDVDAATIELESTCEEGDNGDTALLTAMTAGAN
ncbi:hypothetical protein ROJ8625_03411 [Roseivivax jejudonensis]|uniref:HdeA/HdeB family protein n=1 Tax=Roseivivax jejudonensis TaxID=1529041 RepID=A0A1X7A0E3_9RHOB|nr:HdeA/HdeB family chaperone [Roseivivax jejudonensis]SLN66929.1 hypothetical protein ROJ8625_03411 [Roseivivax jejudonensis]